MSLSAASTGSSQSKDAHGTTSDELPPLVDMKEGEENVSDDDADVESKSDASKKSSYYFFKSTPAEEAQKYAPKPIEKKNDDTTTNAATSTSSSSATSSSTTAGSKWNTAGTFEERDITEYAHDLFKKHMLGTKLKAGSNTVIINKIPKIDGESSIVYTRGKKKVGYDLHIRMNWTTDNSTDAADADADDDNDTSSSSDVVKGSISIPELADFNDLDDTEITITVKSDSDKSSDIKKQLNKQIDSVIKKKLEEFIDELKKQ